jgi:hypothetical protein
MPPPKLTAKSVIFIKTETMQGETIMPAATNALLVEDLEITPVGEQLKRNPKSSTLDKVAHQIGKKNWEIKFKTEMKGSGVAGTPYVPLVAALKAAGWDETINTGVEAIGAAVADGNNSGISPNPVIGIVTGAFSSHSGIVELLLTEKTITEPESATFEAIFTPLDGGDSIVSTAVVTGSGFANVAFSGGMSELKLTVNDPDAGGVGLPISTWRVGDRWKFAYSSADQVNCQYVLADAAASANFFGPGKSATIVVYKDGLKHIAAGSMGEVKISAAKAGESAMAEFTFKGLYADPTDEAFPQQTYSQTLPPKFESAIVTLLGLANTHIISKFEFDPGWTVSMREDAAAPYGVKGFFLSDRDPKGGCDPEAVPVTTDPVIKDFMDGVEAATTIVIGSVSGNIITFSMPKTQYTGAPYADRNGLVTHNLGLKYNTNAGASSIVITFS